MQQLELDDTCNTNNNNAIRLFGQKIPFPGDLHVPPASISPRQEQEEDEEPEDDEIDYEEEDEDEDGDEDGDEDVEPHHTLEEEKHQSHKEDPAAEDVTEKGQEADPPPSAEEAKKSATSDEPIANPKTPTKEEEAVKSKEQEGDASNHSQDQKTLKKPDKILPCPRCNSMDTKFCYYNNYNVNQPRYFCKACQRYWTAGGTMRNVPVGAGRRKNKNSTSHYQHITISEALQAARIDVPNGTHLPALKTNGRVLSFGLDSPICDSMASVLNLGEKKVLNGTRNGFHHGFDDQRLKFPCKSGEKGEDCTNSSSVNVSNPTGESSKSTFQEQPVLQNSSFIPPQVPCLASVPWPYPWNAPVPSPAMCTPPPGFPPVPFYPAAFWNCSVPGNWNVPWLSPHSPSSNPMSPSSGPNSPTLGKHSRDGDIVNQDSISKQEPPKQRNGSILVPKTLRIDDPNEAAKSSIWATLGIKNESASGKGMFKPFQSNKDEKNHVEASSVLRANPAALSRSLNFHENS